MKTSDFHYELPADRIAYHPKRGQSRLLVLDKQSHALMDQHIQDFPSELRSHDLVIFNNTKVIKARLHGHKSSGGAVEVLVERILPNQCAWVHLRASKKPAAGSVLHFGELTATVLGREGALFVLQFACEDVYLALEQHGTLPLPPYIERSVEAADEADYQSIFAQERGAVAAPTASLHFDEALIQAMRDRGVDIDFVTLHVGAGTFQPVRVENLENHVMHAEIAEVSPQICQKIRDTRAKGGRVVAIGTTVVRALESASQSGEIQPFTGDTRLFITPGYAFKSVDALLTNFHLPESTLLMLVSAFVTQEAVLKAYQHAIDQQYRFFSYGDAMWIR
jgi:S-adenosylmethionine:tRNA ribosyltransferase-isomerase